MAGYSALEIEGYFQRIGLPAHYHQRNGREEHDVALEFLSVLQKYQLARVPFENLSLHYSQDRRVSLEPQDLYNKVVNRGRGGFCMESMAAVDGRSTSYQTDLP